MNRKLTFFVMYFLAVPSLFWSYSVVAAPAKEAEQDHEMLAGSDLQSLLLSQGSQLLSLSDYLNRHAQTILKRSNDVRKQLIALKRDPQLKESSEFSSFNKELLGTFDEMRAEASQVRTQAKAQRQHALNLFRLGFEQHLQARDIPVNNTNLDYLTQQLTAFNPKLMSSKPKMVEKAEEKNKALDDKRLILLNERLAEQNKPEKLDVHPIQVSRNQAYIAYFSGEEKNIPLNKIHSWTFVITDIKGHQISDVEIRVDGDMPGHNHGLPTKPQLVKTDQEGVFNVKGMKFQMPGWWVITFSLEKDGQKDQLTFNLDL